MAKYTQSHCRLCLRKCGKKDENAENFSEVYTYCIGAQILSHNIPKKICIKCIDDLNFVSEFKDRCLRTEEELNEISPEFAKEEVEENFVESVDVKSNIKIEIDEVQLMDEYDIVRSSFINPDIKVKRDIFQNSESKELIKRRKKKYKPNGKQMCPICGILYRNISTHINNMHSEKAYFACDLCEKRFKYKHHIKRHILTIHLGQRPYACEFCDKTFKHQTGKSSHVMKFHLKKFKYQCEVCSKQFVSSSDFKNHMTLHDGSQKHSCEFCGKTFRLALSKQCHIRTIHTPGCFECNVCHKTFAHSSYLRRHERVHSDIGYVCPGCGKKHLVGQALRKHMQTHHPDIPQPPAGTNLKYFDWKVFLSTENLNAIPPEF